MITKEIIESVKTFLGEDGVSFFKEMVEEHGEVSPVLDLGYPHSVHFSEGMQVRNHLRRSGLCDSWGDHDFDDNWIEVIEKVITQGVV
jgi:hypothetical protein